MSMLDTLRADREARVTEGKALVKAAEARKEGMTEAEFDRIRVLNEERSSIEARIADLEQVVAESANAVARTGVTDSSVRINREPRVYSPHSEHSFFVDAYQGVMGGSIQARQRLERHMTEMSVERELRAREAQELRSTTTSSFAGLVVPQYLVDQAALALRNGRPVANLCARLPLPDQGMTLTVPRGTTGAATAIQATENTSVQSTDEVWANVSIPVVTIAGQQDVSRQSLERGAPGLDQLVWSDLAGAYAANLDTQVLTGSGAGGQMLGVQNTASIFAATAFGAAPTAVNFASKIAGQIASIAGAGTVIQPRVVIMHPRRWGWLQSLADSSNRPLAVALPLGPYNSAALVTAPGVYSGDGAPTDQARPQFVGMLANGLPVCTDANVPTSVGTNVEDLVFVVDNAQLLLWEDGDGSPRMLRFEQTLGNQLTVKLVAYGYAGFTAGRYPQAVGKIGGLDTVATQGLVAPTF